MDSESFRAEMEIRFSCGSYLFAFFVRHIQVILDDICMLH